MFIVKRWGDLEEEKYFCYGSDILPVIMVFLYTPPSLKTKGLNACFLNRKRLRYYTFSPTSCPTNS